jgi:hypothetical protein
VPEEDDLLYRVPQPPIRFQAHSESTNVNQEEYSDVIMAILERISGFKLIKIN